MKGFFAGLGLGFGLGMLFAPKSGQELRDTVSDKAGELADTAREKYERVREGAKAAVSSIREEGEVRTGTGGY